MNSEKQIYLSSFIASKFINRRTNPKKLSFSNILIFKKDEIGDMITALPVFSELRRQFPSARITLFCRPLMNEFLKNDPNIDLLVNDFNELSGNYDLIIDLRGDYKTIKYAIQIFPKYRLDRGSIRIRNKINATQHAHEVFTNLNIIAPILDEIPQNPQIKLYTDKRNEAVATLFLQRNCINNRFAILHISARKKLKRWSVDKFIALATWLKHTKNLDIVFVGDNLERIDIDRMQKKIPFATYSFAGEGNLLDYAALASKCAIMIGNDSGPMHIAAAMGVPVLGLFGPSEPHLFAPYGEKATYIHHKLSCNPCDQINCVHPNNPCMNRITVEEVLEKIEYILTTPVSSL